MLASEMSPFISTNLGGFSIFLSSSNFTATDTQWPFLEDKAEMSRFLIYLFAIQVYQAESSLVAGRRKSVKALRLRLYRICPTLECAELSG
jgi:hypothetical protein